LIRRHRTSALAVCRHFVGGRGVAEDAVQEACIVAMLNLDRLRTEARFYPWLTGIALNVCRRWMREWRAFPTDRRTPAGDPADIVEEHELAGRVRGAVRSLPVGQREAVAAYYLDGLPHREAAALLGTSVGAVKTRLHKGRAALRRELKGWWVEMGMQKEIVRVHVEGVGKKQEEDGFERFVVMLREVGGDRDLPSWIGPTEGTAIAFHLRGSETPRPMTHHFARSLLAASGARVREVRIERLVDDTFYAQTIVDGPGGARAVDSRPSDALALALLDAIPVAVADDVFEASATRGPLADPDAFGEEYPEGADRIVEAAREAQERAMARHRRGKA